MKALDLLLRAKKYNANITDNEINEAIAELEALQSTHEAQLKQAYINGSNSTNELIQSLYKQIEQLKDTKCY